MPCFSEMRREARLFNGFTNPQNRKSQCIEPIVVDHTQASLMYPRPCHCSPNQNPRLVFIAPDKIDHPISSFGSAAQADCPLSIPRRAQPGESNVSQELQRAIGRKGQGTRMFRMLTISQWGKCS